MCEKESRNMKCTGTEKKLENPPLIRRRRRSNPNHISKDLKDWIRLLDWIGLDWIGLDWIGLDWIGSSDFADFADHCLGDKVEGCILWWLCWASGGAHQSQIMHTVDQILQFPGHHDI